MSRAGESVDELLTLVATVARALAEQGHSFALVGGLATSVLAEPRFTRDVDFAVAVEDDHAAEALIRSLGDIGLLPFALVEQEATGRLATARLRTRGGRLCDLLFAKTGIERDLVSRARPLELVDGLRVPVATREDLVAMKVLSAGPDRVQDLLDLQALRAIGVDLEQVKAALRAITEAGCARGQDLEAKLERLWSLELS